MKRIAVTIAALLALSAAAFGQGSSAPANPNRIRLIEQSSEPAAPASGQHVLFFDTSGVLKKKNSSGTVTVVAGASGSGLTSSGTPAANQVAYWSSSSALTGSGTMYVSAASGILRIGDTPVANLRFGQKLDVQTSANHGGAGFTTWSATAGQRSIIDLTKSATNTVGSVTTVASGDSLGSINFRGADGTEFFTAAQIHAEVDGAVSSSTVPGRLIFFTTNSSGTSTSRWIIDSSGTLKASTDNSWDIGASGATRPRTVYVGTSVIYGAVAFASLGTPANGSVTYCSDCTIANPCAGSGTGAIAKRLNGVWVCN